MPARSTTSKVAYVVFFGLNSAVSRSTRASGTRATPACISPRAVPNDEVATVGAGEQIEQRGLAALGKADEPDLHGRPCYHSRRHGRPAAPRARLLVASLRPLDWRGTTTALMLAALWGANPVAVKVGLADAPPLRLAFFRFVLGGLVILAYAGWTRHRGVFDVRRGEWRVLISLGVIFSVQIGTMNVGIGLTTASHGAVLLNSYAVHTVVLAHFMIPGDRLTPAKLGGVLDRLHRHRAPLRARLLLPERDPGRRPRGGGQRGPARGAGRVHGARGADASIRSSCSCSSPPSGAPASCSRAWRWSRAPRRATRRRSAASLFYQGAVVAGFNFIVNSYLFKVYRRARSPPARSPPRSSASSSRPRSPATSSARCCCSRASWSPPASASPSAADRLDRRAPAR